MTAQSGKKKGSGASCPCVQILDGCGQEDRAIPFSVAHTGKTRGNDHKLKYRKLHLNIRKKNFTVKMIEDLSLVIQ